MVRQDVDFWYMWIETDNGVVAGQDTDVGLVVKNLEFEAREHPSKASRKIRYGMKRSVGGQ